MDRNPPPKGCFAPFTRSYAPQVDLSLLRVVAVCVHPVIVAYGALWVIAPRPDRMMLPTTA